MYVRRTGASGNVVVLFVVRSKVNLSFRLLFMQYARVETTCSVARTLGPSDGRQRCAALASMVEQARAGRSAGLAQGHSWAVPLREKALDELLELC